MEEKMNAYRILVGKAEEDTSLGRPRSGSYKNRTGWYEPN
jgi:hypothetical protein